MKINIKMRLDDLFLLISIILILICGWIYVIFGFGMLILPLAGVAFAFLLAYLVTAAVRTIKTGKW